MRGPILSREGLVNMNCQIGVQTFKGNELVLSGELQRK